MSAKKISKGQLAAVGITVALSALPARYAAAETEAIDISAQVLNSFLAAIQSQTLNFGAFTAGTAPGTVEIDASGGTTYTGVNNVSLVTPTEGIVTISGNAGPNVIVSITDPTVVVSNTTAQTMLVNQFNINTDLGGTTEIVNMSMATIAVPIGATLNVNPNQAVGSYTGTFTVDAVYQ